MALVKRLCLVIQEWRVGGAAAKNKHSVKRVKIYASKNGRRKTWEGTRKTT